MRRAFDYLPPRSSAADLPAPGTRVRVPFGRGSRVGVVLEHLERTDVPAERLRRVSRVLDREPLLDAHSLAFLRWSSEYFHHPIGEVVLGALPAGLRAGKPFPERGESGWRLTASGRELGCEHFARAPRRRDLWMLLGEFPDGARQSQLARLDGDWRRALATMQKQGWVERVEIAADDGTAAQAQTRASHPTPSDEQRDAIESVYAARDRYAGFLLDGVTGSGKTEVYLAVI